MNNVKENIKNDHEIDTLGVIVLNWNGASDTIACLEALSKSEYKLQYLLIVDNGSTDDSVVDITDWGRSTGMDVHVFDQILDHTVEKNELNKKYDMFTAGQLFILKLEENCGYTGGNNAGIKWMLKREVDAVFICNNDTMVYPNTLSAMISTINQNKDVGVSSCKIVSNDNKSVINPGGNLIYWLGVHFYWRFKDSRIGEEEVNFVPGCTMMIRTSLLRTIGGFREDFFLYADDIEFCNRVIRSGWKIVINLDAKIRSQVGGGGGSAVYYYFVTRNTLIFINEELKGVQRFVAFMAFYIERIIQMGSWLFIKRWDRIKGVIQGFRDYSQGVRGPGWAGPYLAEHAESSSRPRDKRKVNS